MASLPSIPELDRRLLQSRDALGEDLEALGARVREDLRELKPDRQMRRHPGLSAGLALVAGLIAGRLFAALVNLAWRR